MYRILKPIVVCLVVCGCEALVDSSGRSILISTQSCDYVSHCRRPALRCTSG
nr:MAG TPA: hypothetical protein [Caudoviricetes sp.]